MLKAEAFQDNHGALTFCLCICGQTLSLRLIRKRKKQANPNQVSLARDPKSVSGVCSWRGRWLPHPHGQSACPGPRELGDRRPRPSPLGDAPVRPDH